MYDHFRPPDHFTFWQALAYRLSGAAIVMGGLVLIAVYVLPWLDARYFSPAVDWIVPRYTALFGSHDILAGSVFFVILFAPWVATHLYARRLAKRNREKALENPPQ